MFRQDVGVMCAYLQQNGLRVLPAKKALALKNWSPLYRKQKSGLNDGELGGGLIKKRVARAGSGKRGGYRTIIVYRVKKRAVFVYGFAKNAADNINDAELHEYQKLAQIYLGFNDTDIEKALKIGELKEVKYDGKDTQKISE